MVNYKDNWMQKKDIRSEDILLGTDLNEQEIMRILKASNKNAADSALYNRANILRHSLTDYKEKRLKSVARVGEDVLRYYTELKTLTDKLDLNLTTKFFHLWLSESGKINIVDEKSLESLFTRVNHKTSLKYNPYNLKALLIFRLRKKGKRLEGVTPKSKLDEILFKALNEQVNK